MELQPNALESVRRRRDAMREAMDRLEWAIARPAASSDWAGMVGHALVDLRTAHAAHVEEVEGPDGLLTDLVREAPRLSGPIDVLRHDHDLIDGSIGELLASSFATHPDETRERITQILGRLVRHRQKGSDLLWEAYGTDIGDASH
ncbi:MAG: hypothetical protein OEX04_08150 [Acidimicrobiia bacterium]|nr:hypothetical protein [Acidimicrobiia bacterium]MDH4307438.1 hypothetical protein [Acidimicrobiia bacterium]MDH5295012.1 hypothetical protein [Acidimicrobiia bacterium]